MVICDKISQRGNPRDTGAELPNDDVQGLGRGFGHAGSVRTRVSGQCLRSACSYRLLHPGMFEVKRLGPSGALHARAGGGGVV